jgi:hypothetical protein
MINLPYELLYEICYYLPIKDILSLKMTNKEDIAYHMEKNKDYLFRIIGQRDFGNGFFQIAGKDNEQSYKIISESKLSCTKHGNMQCGGYNLSAIKASFRFAAGKPLTKEKLSNEEENKIIDFVLKLK